MASVSAVARPISGAVTPRAMSRRTAEKGIPICRRIAGRIRGGGRRLHVGLSPLPCHRSHHRAVSGRNLCAALGRLCFRGGCRKRI